MKLLFLYLVILILHNVISGNDEVSTENNKTNTRKTAGDDKIKRAGANEKFLVMILFADDKVCIGAMISKVRLMTSPGCLERFRFMREIYETPCRVFAGSASDIGKDKGVWRHCLSSEVPKRKSKQKMETDVENNQPSFDKLFKPWVKDYIELDVAFDPLLMEIAAVGPPAKQGEQCKVYGFKKDTNKSSGDTTERAHSASGSIKFSVYVRNAIALPQRECKKLYSENMDSELPQNQYCVVEGGIEDIGRLLFCNNKLAGTIADDLAIVKRGNDIVYGYINISAAKRPLLNTFLLIYSIVVAVIGIGNNALIIRRKYRNDFD